MSAFYFHFQPSAKATIPHPLFPSPNGPNERLEIKSQIRGITSSRKRLASRLFVGTGERPIRGQPGAPALPLHPSRRPSRVAAPTPPSPHSRAPAGSEEAAARHWGRAFWPELRACKGRRQLLAVSLSVSSVKTGARGPQTLADTHKKRGAAHLCA